MILCSLSLSSSISDYFYRHIWHGGDGSAAATDDTRRREIGSVPDSGATVHRLPAAFEGLLEAWGSCSVLHEDASRV